MNDISSPKCFELYERCGLGSSSQRTFVACLVSNLDEYSPKLSHHWKAKVTRSLRFVFQLAPSGHRTDGTGSGLLGTPTSTNRERSPETMQKCADFRKRNANQNTVPLYLAEQIQILRTPQASDGEKGGPNQRDSSGSPHLSMQIAMLPTPKAQNANSPGEHGQGGKDLQTTVAMLPTPHGFSQDGKSNGPSGNEIGRTVGQNTGLRLQANFVEWMQGFPINWTSLECPTAETTE